MMAPRSSDADLDSIGRGVAREFDLPYGGVVRRAYDDILVFYLASWQFRVANCHHRPSVRDDLVGQVALERFVRPEKVGGEAGGVEQRLPCDSCYSLYSTVITRMTC